jgi:hypothetical protein
MTPVVVHARFGRLKVTALDPHPRYVQCVCDCGRSHRVLKGSLRSGRSKSCGCLRRELVTRNNTTHGLTDSPTYRSWTAMWSRCRNPVRDAWAQYGMTGVKVCVRWKSFDNFFADMGPRPSGTSLERRNNAKGYCKANCVWADKTTQAWNRRSTVWVQLGVERLPRSVWARRLGISDWALTTRLSRMSVKDALNLAIPLPKAPRCK